ncbi:MAG: trypsin-like serine protease [Halobacteriovoraceae bacterium]|jgi:hypothetical protein|nr:trypsin-like serine protease [Halobacteriovoraceae bacterium]
MKQFMNFLSVFTPYLIILVGVSCGKNIEKSDPAPRGERGARQIPPGEYIKKQKFVCENVDSCPNNIAKIVIFHNDKTVFCTGTLISENEILTSASCIPRSLRIPSYNCAENIRAIFPKTATSLELRVGCTKIRKVDLNLSKEPPLWQGDVAIIELDTKVEREHAQISLDGVRDNEQLVAWKVDLLEENISVLKKDICQPILNTYLNPFSQNKYSPMFVAKTCQLTVNNKGAPLTREGKLVGIFAQEMDGRIYDFLGSSSIMTEELDRYYHFSNLSCQKLKNKVDTPKHCLIETSVEELDFMRAEILKGLSHHREKMKEIKEDVLEVKGKYFLWDLAFKANHNKTAFELHLARPKCIYKSKRWIKEFKTWRGKIRNYGLIKYDIPHYVFRTTLNANLRASSLLEDLGTKTFEVKFNPYRAHVKRLVSLTITGNLFENIVIDDYEDITANCP